MRIAADAGIGVLIVTAVLLAGCSSAASPPASAPGQPVRVEVKLLDTFRIEPSAMTVPVGAPVTFVITNAGVIDHEFYVGDEAAQQHHEEEMAGMGGMMAHDDPMGIAVDPGQTRELTITFEGPADLLGACHVTGHYAAGMRAPITVGP
jgi:uncharacterized cupredoxin-like copper-binding protein